MVNQDGLPDLSAIGQKVPASVGIASLVRTMDERGQIEVDLKLTNQGLQPLPRREQLVSAEDLVGMIEVMVKRVLRDELKYLLPPTIIHD